MDSASLTTSFWRLTVLMPVKLVVPLFTPSTPTVVFTVGFTFTMLTPMPTAPTPALRPIR